MGVEVSVEGLTKSFGSQKIWEDVTFTLPEGEVSALLGPSGTGKSVFLKSLIGLLRPERGKIIIDGTDILQCTAKELYEIRKLFGVLFQDGALFGSMDLYDNVAFPLREHTRKSESQIRDIVWTDFSVALPVFLTVLVMPLTYSIANGIGVGFVSWVVVRAFAGKARTISPLLWIVAAGFLVSGRMTASLVSSSLALA